MKSAIASNMSLLHNEQQTHIKRHRNIQQVSRQSKLADLCSSIMRPARLKRHPGI
jgi:hypothetical protein